MALLAHGDLSSGSSAFRVSGEVPSLRLVAEWELADDASFSITPGLAWPGLARARARGDGGERYLSGILVATFSRPQAGAVRGFVELAGRELRSERRGGKQLTFDTGVTLAMDHDT